MKCLILGGNGFLGKHICRRLLDEGHEVIIFDMSETHNFADKDKVTYLRGNFLNSDDISKAIRGCDVIYHLIWSTVPKNSNEDMVNDVYTNVIGTIQMLSIAVKTVRKVIFVSSGGTVYGIPQSLPIKENHPTLPICSYGISKLTIERYLHLFYSLHGLDYIVLRVSNLYGTGQRAGTEQGAIGVFLDKACSDACIDIWGDGMVTRDYVYVKDAAKAFVKALHYQGKEKIFNIGSGEGKKINDIIEAIELLLGRPVKRKYLAARNFDVPANILDCSLAKQELGWLPKIGFIEGISQTIAEYYSKSDATIGA